VHVTTVYRGALSIPRDGEARFSERLVLHELCRRRSLLYRDWEFEEDLNRLRNQGAGAALPANSETPRIQLQDRPHELPGHGPHAPTIQLGVTRTQRFNP
jgi:hypothetical protein